MPETERASKCTPPEELEGLRRVVSTPHGKEGLARIGAYVLGVALLGFAAGYAVEKASQ